MRIDPKSHTPIYLQIVERMRTAVATGAYRAGEALPSLRVLAIELQVNPNTVQRAYDELEREGLVASRKGRGVFVARRGERSAQQQAEASVLKQLREAVRAARAAGLDDERLEGLFTKAQGAASGERR